jgi:hypothetical protein
MAFYIYENWQAGPHKLVIHDGSCGFCNEGHGMAGGTNPAYGRWHGSFPTISAARDFAETNPAVVKQEHRCVR